MASGVAFGENMEEGGTERVGREVLRRTSARGNKLRHVFNKNSKQEERKDT
jgi:hypothetical protein